jgi:hypothetical protein
MEVMPIPDEYDPPGHGVQTPEGEAVPGAHGAHVPLERSPHPMRNAPGVHAEVLHTAQDPLEVPPQLVTYLPTGQCTLLQKTHELQPVCEKVFGGHVTHAVHPDPE